MLQAFFKPIVLLGCLLWGLGLYILLNLGLWQVQRLEWKNDLEKQLEQQISIEITNYPSLKTIALELSEEEEHIYRVIKTEIQEILIHKSIFVGPRIHVDIRGYHLYTPILMAQNAIIYMHLGWVSEEFKSKFEEQSNTPKPFDREKIHGYISTPPSLSSFGNTNAPSRNIWTQVDLAAFLKHHDFKSAERFIPYILVPETKVFTQFNPITWLKKSLDDDKEHYAPPKSLAQIELRNNHFQYLMFWFSMALIWTLLGAYGAYRTFKRTR